MIKIQKPTTQKVVGNFFGRVVLLGRPPFGRTEPKIYGSTGKGTHFMNLMRNFEEDDFYRIVQLVPCF